MDLRQLSTLVAIADHEEVSGNFGEAATLLRRLLAGERWEKHMIRMPIKPPSVTLLTARGAYADMINEGQRHIGPDLPVVSILGGFVFGDVREGGITILTYGRGEKPKALARQLGVKEGAVKSMVLRLRRRFRMLLQEEVAQTVGTESEVEAELKHLSVALAGR